MSTIGSGENQLYFEWSGLKTGRVLVLSHSLGADVSLWNQNLPEWESRFRILRYDHRGHGRSALPKGEWSIADFGRDLVCLLDALELDQVSFCGVSLGGMVGLWMAQQDPSRINRLVVANTSAFTEDPSLLRGRITKARSEGMEAIVEDVLGKWFTPTFHRSSPEVVDRFRLVLLNTSAEAYARTSEAVCGLDLRSGLSEVKTPTLVITGSEDQATPKEWGELIRKSIPGAELWQAQAAHLSNAEVADQFGEKVSQFLDS